MGDNSSKKFLEYKKGEVSADVREHEGQLNLNVRKDLADKDHTIVMETITVNADGNISVLKGAISDAQNLPPMKTFEGKDAKFLAEVKAAYQGFKKDGILEAKEVSAIEALVEKGTKVLTDVDKIPAPRGGNWR